MDPYNYQRMYPQWYGQQPLPSMQPSMQPGVLPQPIQKVNQSSEEQAVCYFVKSPEEVASIKALPLTWYLGINENAKEIYVRKMKADGTVGTDIYRLSEAKQEKTEMQVIAEKVDNIEQLLKGKADGPESNS